MQNTVPTPQDANMVLQAAVTKTADFNSTALDLGAGWTPGGLGMPVAAVVDVSAADRADSNETYDFYLEESSDNSSFTRISVAASVPVSGATATVGVVVVKAFSTKRYIRLVLDVSGTTPSVTYSANLNTVMQR